MKSILRRCKLGRRVKMGMPSWVTQIFVLIVPGRESNIIVLPNGVISQPNNRRTLYTSSEGRNSIVFTQLLEPLCGRPVHHSAHHRPFLPER